ncbi:type I-C CRISPR-associated protein Cas7/Csd2 [Actinacidiphila acididurans]|uniref:Type I-C CRISPR-associated protein Cas7/Csd2 n=1 Tax=Actinacidiphila acididurans TaxID=2784346 RepID=A0ABS2TY15_9ACTN|nr:type I-C CRISPR-associated protein Cas7/Csd2 [Actinacidiphila acididurans]MBM9507972.1 type I-C CRISPR-associated protein Cas7/Csd2 [Actinacidiphila acididurans]
MTEPHLDPAKKHDFVFLIDVRDGNPNGDPDAGGMPRIDPVSMQGLITDVAIKRKIRNTTALLKEGVPGYEIYVESGVALNAQHERAYTDGKATDAITARTWMCQNFFDVRMFGAVMTTGKKEKTAGRVQGPVQISFSRSIDPITPQEIGITRVTPTRTEDLKTKETEMGSKHIVPYGLYLGTGHFSAPLAKRTGVTSDDLEVFWRAFTLMLEHDRASSRGEMTLRGLYVFTHNDAYGKAPAHQLFNRINVKPTGTPTTRSYDDYTTEINDTDLPDGITLTRILD